MAPHNTTDEPPASTSPEADSAAAAEVQFPLPPPQSAKPPRILIIGAGSRGRVYARCTRQSSNGIIAAVAEPDDLKRLQFGRKFIWGNNSNNNPGDNENGDHTAAAVGTTNATPPPPPEGSQFPGWREFVTWETARRAREQASGGGGGDDPDVPEGIDAVFVCVRDELHHDVVVALAALNLHVMCEKPFATTLADCSRMYRALAPHQSERVYSVGHVLRYSPHNMLLRKLLLEDRAIGDILSVVHTEPVGFWHFAHSYVRGNWRRESTTAPSLLTKSCHDIDIIMWLLCSPPPGAGADAPPHLPSTVASAGSLQFFKKSRKPKAAGNATNCFSCPVEKDCIYSSKRVYVGGEHQGLETGNTGWPISVVFPDMESFGKDQRKEVLLDRLAEDYGEATTQEEIDSRNWFGRCVFESDNDVCDEQTVTMTWDEDPLPASSTSTNTASTDSLGGRGSKQATFHMIAQTKQQCHRYSHVYGTEGEIYADSNTITIEDFRTNETKVYEPKLESLGHGGGDHGLTRKFILAVDKVKNHGWAAEKAQQEYIGCTLEDIIRSHAVVFAAEEARTTKKVIDWKDWWKRNVGEMDT